MGARRSLLAPPRPDTVGDLLGAVWQLGYVTSDLERAGQVLTGRFGLAEPAGLPSRPASYFAGEEPIEPWRANYSVGVAGDLFVELIEPVAGPAELYGGVLPADGSFAVRLHHLAVTVPAGDEEWDRVREMLAGTDLGFDFSVEIPGRIRAAYVDTSAELGHMIEICQFAEETAASYADLLDEAGGTSPVHRQEGEVV